MYSKLTSQNMVQPPGFLVSCEPSDSGAQKLSARDTKKKVLLAVFETESTGHIILTLPPPPLHICITVKKTNCKTLCDDKILFK